MKISYLNHDSLIGIHEPNGGEGLTIRELLNLLHSVPPQARDNYLRVCTDEGVCRDVTGIAFGQSDQAEKWDFKAYIRLEKEGR